MTAAELRAATWHAIVRALDEPRSTSSAVPDSWGAIHAAIDAEIAAARQNERTIVVKAAQEILHGEGWIGGSEQRIVSLAWPLPEAPEPPQ